MESIHKASTIIWCTLLICFSAMITSIVIVEICTHHQEEMAAIKAGLVQKHIQTGREFGQIIWTREANSNADNSN